MVMIELCQRGIIIINFDIIVERLIVINFFNLINTRVSFYGNNVSDFNIKNIMYEHGLFVTSNSS